MKRLVLLGGGHAQIHVLADFARRALTGCDVQLVTPFRRLVYSGMLPGWVAGHYPIDACTIDLERLALNAGARFHQTSGVGLDLLARVLHCADGSALSFDALSIDTGPVPVLQGLPGSEKHALAVRPIERFIEAWPQLAKRISVQSQRFDLAILGAGAAGVELAFAIRHRAATNGWQHLAITLTGTEDLPLPGIPMATRRHTARLLSEHNIHWLPAKRATRIHAQSIEFDSGPTLGFDTCLAATGAAAPDWPREAGLATDEKGFICVAPTLQSLSHQGIFAAGDVAAYADPRPKSGVYAVRAGEILAANLRAACEGRPLQSWSPQTRALYLISTGNRYALATWGRWSWSGKWVWRWKDHIDRRFIDRFSEQRT